MNSETDYLITPTAQMIQKIPHVLEDHASMCSAVGQPWILVNVKWSSYMNILIRDSVTELVPAPSFRFEAGSPSCICFPQLLHQKAQGV